MEITLTTPALLFPAISLLLLAHTNRFLALAGVIRSLSREYQSDINTAQLSQIQTLRKRIILVKWTQWYGATSLLGCVACMFALFIGQLFLGKLLFGLSLILMLISLALSVWEINQSVHALEILLRDVGHSPKDSSD